MAALCRTRPIYPVLLVYMGHDTPRAGGRGMGGGLEPQEACPRCTLGCIVKALIHLIKGLYFFKLQLKAVHDWNLTNLSNACRRMFPSIAQICPCFLRPIHG